MKYRYFIIFSRIEAIMGVETYAVTNTGKIFNRKQVVTDIAQRYGVHTSSVCISGWQEFANEEDFNTYLEE